MPEHPLPYRTIACGTYDLFEAAAMHRHRVRLQMTDGTVLVGLISDVFARGKEEFCRFHEQAAVSPVEIRLDSVAEITDLDDGTRLSTGAC